MPPGGVAQNHQVLRVNLVLLCVGSHMLDGKSQIHLGKGVAVGAVAVVENKRPIARLLKAFCGFIALVIEGKVLISAAGADNHRRTSAL